MDGLRIQPIGYQPPNFSYRSLRLTPNVVRLLGAPTFLQYILLRRAKLSPLLFSSAIGSGCATQQCNPSASSDKDLAPRGVSGALAMPYVPASPRQIPELDLDWPHAIATEKVTVYIYESQPSAAPPQPGSIIDLLF